ncbi:hypothetical protein Ancab_012162 [Ancistrocladus abbreviatus]
MEMQEYGYYGHGSRAERSMVRFIRSHRLRPGQLSSLASSRKNVSNNHVSPSELSPSLFDLHSLDTELLPEMPCPGLYGGGSFMCQCLQIKSFDDFETPTNKQNGTNRPRALQENNLLRSLSVDKDKVNSIVKIKVVGKDYEVLEESYEQVKLPSKKITLEDKMRKANGQTKWKDLPKVDHKNTDSDGDLNGLLQEMNLLVEVDQPGNQLNGYITRLDAILSQKATGTL